jgi:GT2 family glycosyltransferase
VQQPKPESNYVRVTLRRERHSPAPAPLLLVVRDRQSSIPTRTQGILLNGEKIEIDPFELNVHEKLEVVSAPASGPILLSIKPRTFISKARLRINSLSKGKRSAQKNAESQHLAAKSYVPDRPVFNSNDESVAGIGVSVILPTRDRQDLLQQAVEGLFLSARWPELELVILDNGSVDTQTLDYLDTLKSNERVKIVRVDRPFNYSELMNIGAANASMPMLIMANNDVICTDPDWVDPLVRLAAQKSVGVVGIKLLYPDQTLQHFGIVLGMQGLTGHAGRGIANAATSGLPFFMGTRQVSAVTGAVLATRAEVFDALGGFDETLAIEFNDIDYCLRARRAGFDILVTDNPTMIHLESATRKAVGSTNPVILDNQITFFKRWANNLIQDDWYPSELCRSHEDFKLEASPKGTL